MAAAATHNEHLLVHVQAHAVAMACPFRLATSMLHGAEVSGLLAGWGYPA